MIRVKTEILHTPKKQIPPLSNLLKAVDGWTLTPHFVLLEGAILRHSGLNERIGSSKANH
jgi:hypothetical protein